MCRRVQIKWLIKDDRATRRSHAESPFQLVLKLNGLQTICVDRPQKTRVITCDAFFWILHLVQEEMVKTVISKNTACKHYLFSSKTQKTRQKCNPFPVVHQCTNVPCWPISIRLIRNREQVLGLTVARESEWERDSNIHSELWDVRDLWHLACLVCSVALCVKQWGHYVNATEATKGRLQCVSSWMCSSVLCWKQSIFWSSTNNLSHLIVIPYCSLILVLVIVLNICTKMAQPLAAFWGIFFANFTICKKTQNVFLLGFYGVFV